MKNFLQRSLVLVVLVTAPLVAMDNVIKKIEKNCKDIGIDILKQTAKKNIKKTISSIGTKLLFNGSTIIAINALNQEEKYSSKNFILETVLRAIEIGSILNSEKISNAITIKSIEVPFDKRPKTTRFLINRYLKKHDVGLEPTIMGAISSLSQEALLGIISTECGIRGIQQLFKTFSAPDDQKLPNLANGLLNTGVSAGIIFGSHGLMAIKKQAVSLYEQKDIKKFEQAVDEFLKNITTYTVTPEVAKWIKFLSLAMISGTGAIYGVKAMAEATKELTGDKNTSTKMSIGKFLFGSFLVGGAAITIVNMEGLANFAVKTDNQVSPVNTFFNRLTTLVGNNIDNHFSLNQSTSKLFDDFL